MQLEVVASTYTYEKNMRLLLHRFLLMGKYGESL